ncbi:MAG: RnfABCDGE type electron transport complex subunit D [Limnochordia bacterium]
MIVSTAPHLRDEDSVPRMMFSVVLSLIPAVVAAVYFFRLHALAIILTCVITALVAEVLAQKARGMAVTLWDGSALLTGLLLALTLPPSLPLWMAALGSIFAIIVGKQVFGGLGNNPFNPALVGRAFLMASFPVYMTTWWAPFDTVSATTPLVSSGVVSYSQLYLGFIPGSLGETSALALLFGALYLFYREYIDYRIPAGIFGTVILLSLLTGQDPIFHLLSGGLLLGALYMATDPVTSPLTKKGRWIFGIGVGALTIIIRLWGGMPEGVSYAILIMNGFAPLISRYTRPRIFGHGEVRANG